MSYCDDQNILKCVVHYVKFKFNWVSCILSGKCCDLWLLREWGWGWDKHREAWKRHFPLEPANHGMGAPSTAPLPPSAPGPEIPPALPLWMGLVFLSPLGSV